MKGLLIHPAPDRNIITVSETDLLIITAVDFAKHPGLAGLLAGAPHRTVS